MRLILGPTFATIFIRLHETISLKDCSLKFKLASYKRNVDTFSIYI